MKICQQHTAQVSSALREVGLDGTVQPRQASRHSHWSAAEWEILNRGYQTFGIRAVRDDICPLCELSEDTKAHDKCIHETVKNVKARHDQRLKDATRRILERFDDEDINGTRSQHG